MISDTTVEKEREMEAPFARRFGITLLCAFGLTLVACSSSPSGGTSTTSTPLASSTASPAGSPATSSTPPASGGLSGTWSGRYSGAFQGTFTLTWQQSGSNLSGTIDLSSDGSPSINGTVQGNAIRFGTVGSEAITYTGSVSGNSMSGTYQVANGGSGTWSASKTS